MNEKYYLFAKKNRLMVELQKKHHFFILKNTSKHAKFPLI